mgnify:CR=1 FL=1
MVEIEPNRLHRRLKRALTAKGISQRELAEGLRRRRRASRTT